MDWRLGIGVIGLWEDGGGIWSLEDGRLIILRMEDGGWRMKIKNKILKFFFFFFITKNFISGSARFRSVQF